jgi:hypothetical protein
LYFSVLVKCVEIVVDDEFDPVVDEEAFYMPESLRLLSVSSYDIALIPEPQPRYSESCERTKATLIRYRRRASGCEIPASVVCRSMDWNILAEDRSCIAAS